MTKNNKLKIFFMAMLLTVDGIRTSGDGEMVAISLTNSGKEIIASRNPETTRAEHNDKVILRVTIDSFGLRFGTPSAPTNKRHLFGPFGTRRL